MPAFTSLKWDIFCTVIDNYGDIGVTWRLARRLVHELGQQVRLWVDDLESFSRIASMLDTTQAEQTLDDITICHWHSSLSTYDSLPDVVIAAFGCNLPESYIDAMAQRQPRPVWINLEYLSAEDWVERCHGLPSPHPRHPLTKYFFFPGFTAKTGGLLGEQNLLATRQQWQQDTLAQKAYWQQFNIPEKQPGECRVSLFAYENPAATDLLNSWVHSPYPVSCIVPTGKILPDVCRALGQPLQAGQSMQKGQLTVHVIPMTDQNGYDLLLWSCDINFVRGEDSFVRAQWAGRPFFWHIYPQDEQAHLIKLDAFLSHYTATVSPALQAAIYQSNHAWNLGQNMPEAWQNLGPHWAEWQKHSSLWAEKQLESGDLAERLVQFIQNQLK